jgi:hypothetical protein
MKRASSVIAVAFGFTAAIVSAQEPAPAPRGGAPQPPAGATRTDTQKDQAGTVSYTGCIQAADASAGAKPGSFMLMNATTGAASATGTSGAATPGAAPEGAAGAGRTSASAGTNYILDGGDNFAANVGKRVEVRGKLATSTAPAGTSGASSPAAQHIQVSNVRVLGDCAAGK